MASAGHHRRPVQTCSLEDLPHHLSLVLTSSSGHQNTYGYDAGGTLPTGMPSCYRPQRSCGKVIFLRLSVILFTGGCLADTPWPDMPLGRQPPPLVRHPLSRHPLARHMPPGYVHCSGRYASYWDAFLLQMLLNISYHDTRCIDVVLRLQIRF